ncbi:MULTISPECIES: CoA transferase [Pigmentiphaga]|uniref:CoA transferase n=1 Tax=Pigmentiphaga daeguensis TaxID=414049 RepID=A0ABN1CA20_9BURK
MITKDEEEALSMDAPLQGMRVLDFTLFLSGPFGTQILGDMGADVIKVEPANGDQTRYLPPNFVAGDSAYFLSVNRNKESIQIDYKTPDGLALIERLAQESDVFVENQKPGNLAKYGITYERLSALNPRLVWCSISGFGQQGPYAGRPAYDMIVQALSGGMSMTGESDGKPVRSAIPIGDIAAGMYAVMGVLGALHARHRTGKGAYIDISMLDCQIAMLSYQAAYYLHSGRIPARQGRGHESIPSYRAFTAGDGVDFVVCANTDRMWHALCDVAGVGAWGRSAHFLSRQNRYEHRHEIWRVLEDALLARPAAEWVELLHSADVPVAMVNTVDQALADVQVRQRGMVLTLESEAGQRVSVAGNPVKMTGIDESAYRYPPSLGADTKSVLQRLLGITEEEAQDLARRKIINING